MLTNPIHEETLGTQRALICRVYKVFLFDLTVKVQRETRNMERETWLYIICSASASPDSRNLKMDFKLDRREVTGIKKREIAGMTCNNGSLLGD